MFGLLPATEWVDRPVVIQSMVQALDQGGVYRMAIGIARTLHRQHESF